MSDAFFEDLKLDRSAPEPISAQITRRLRFMILNHQIHAGTKLPSSRMLARDLEVGRNTVLVAYETLVSEGLLQTRPGGGTFVTPHGGDRPGRPDGASFRPSARAGRLLDAWDGLLRATSERVFSPGVPATDAFPFKTWKQSMSRGCTRMGRGGLDFCDPAGWPPLREAIAAHVGPSRGVVCEPDQIVVLSTVRQGFEIAARLLLDHGDPVLVESPGFPEARVTFEATGNPVHPLPVDAEGADISAVTGASARARLASVTPCHQYPSGYVMSEARRAELLDWAERTDAYIVEDDYDGEFWTNEMLHKPLHTEDLRGRVIYLNSFSKTLFPSLRLAFMVCPRHLVEAAVELKSMMDNQVSAPAQFATQDFIMSGAYNKHLREMRWLYAQRRKVLEYELRRLMAHCVEPIPGDSGLHLSVLLPGPVRDTELVRAFQGAGGGATALSNYFHGDVQAMNGLVMGFSGWEAQDLSRGVHNLSEIYHQLVPCRAE